MSVYECMQIGISYGINLASMKNAMKTTTTTEGNQTAVNPIDNASTAPRSQRRHSMKNLTRRGRVWYFKKLVQGKRVFVSLDTEDLTLAKARRDDKIRQATRDELHKIKGPRGDSATIAQVLKAYEDGAQSASDRIEGSTVATNAGSLKNVIRWAHGTAGKRNEEMDPGAVKVNALDDELVAKFKANFLATAGEDREVREQRRRSARSILTQARSVFSAAAMILYKGLNMPDVTVFRKAAKMQAENRVHKPIATATLKQMAKDMESMRTENPELWLVHLLAKHVGLRNDEIKQARVEWFNRAPWGQVFFSVTTRPYYEPKGSQGHVPICTEVAAMIAPFVADKKPQDFLIKAANPTDRAELVDRTHANWIRKYLPAGEYAKAGYELRRWSAQVIEERYGRDAAEAFLRHSPKTVAERHYFERWFPWRRCGTDVGVTLADAAGKTEKQEANLWVEGAAALEGLVPVQAAQRAG